VPGGDVNPYLALAGLVAAALSGVREPPAKPATPGAPWVVQRITPPGEDEEAGAAGAADPLLELPPPVTGNAYTLAGLPRVPATLDEALALWEKSELAAGAFGTDVVSHYATMARVELDAYRAAVTDWELRRYFERI
jgi:glutamine synthetase